MPYINILYGELFFFFFLFPDWYLSCVTLMSRS